MILVKTVEIDIDINFIIDNYRLDSNSNWDVIMLAVRKYISCHDDELYDYVDNDEDKRKIAQTIAEKLKKEE